MNLNCQKHNGKELLPSYAVGKNWFHTYLELEIGNEVKYNEKPCYLKYDNCVICGGNPGNKCQLCFDGYYLINSTDENGVTET